MPAAEGVRGRRVKCNPWQAPRPGRGGWSATAVSRPEKENGRGEEFASTRRSALRREQGGGSAIVKQLKIRRQGKFFSSRGNPVSLSQVLHLLKDESTPEQ